MYKVFSAKVLILAVSWLVMGLYFIIPEVNRFLDEFTNYKFRTAAIPSLAWVVISLVLWKPVWRFFWKLVPPLNKWIFPDLNGEWDVELFSNWPRQVQLLEAAMSEDKKINMRQCDESHLAELTPIQLRARIHQTWWEFEIQLYNPNNNTPIDRSYTISVEPFRGTEFQPPGICYIYKQQNQTDNVSDDNEFFGAARLTYNFSNKRLTGVAWTARMWRRAMNTAGPITFTRRRSASLFSKWYTRWRKM